MAEFSSVDSSFVQFYDQNQRFIPTPINPNFNNFGDGYNLNLNNVESTFSQFSIFSQGPNDAAINDHSGYSEEMVQDNGNLDNNGGGTTEAAPQANPQSYPLNPRTIMHLPQWPEAPVPFGCTNCQVLREIIHTNGVDFTRLEIHGTLGFIAHGILNYKYSVPSSSGQQDGYLMVDFSQRGIDEIKDVLTKYCQDQSAEGFVLVADPFSSYYEALTIGLEWTEDFNDDTGDQNHTTSVVPDLNPSTSGGMPGNVERVAGARCEAERNVRISLAAQRERAANMSLADLKDYFHVPIEVAARRLNLSITVVKKICRKDKLGRWPYRKVSSIVKQVSLLRKKLETQDEVAKARTQAEIDRLMEEMVESCGGVTPTTLNFQ